MKTPLAVALLALTISTASARILESSKEILARYGNPITSRAEDSPIPGLKRFYFQKNGIRVSVVIQAGQSIQETFVHADNSEMAPGEIATLVRANLGEKAYDDETGAISSLWISERGRAMYEKQMLTVESNIWRQANIDQEAKKKREENSQGADAVKGF